MVRTFKEVIDRLSLGSSEDRKRGKEISAILGQIGSLKFVLELSGSCDIYNTFGHGVNILQKVNILPHIKYDQFVDTVVETLDTMADNLVYIPTIKGLKKTLEFFIWPQTIF